LLSSYISKIEGHKESNVFSIEGVEQILRESMGAFLSLINFQKIRRKNLEKYKKKMKVET